MKTRQLALPTIGLIAATRGMLGAGIGLLLADKLAAGRRRTVGNILLTIGVLSTIPLVRKVIRSGRSEPSVM